MSSRVLLGVTGSVAAVRVPELLRGLRGAGCSVKVVATAHARAFFVPEELPPPPALELTDHPPELARRGQQLVYDDADEWPVGGLFKLGAPVLHIELRRWADLLLIAPLDANTLGKLTAGICDNLLTCVYRAWDPTCPVVLAPAMNTAMWLHPATTRQLRTLSEEQGHGGRPAASAAEAVAAINASCPLLRVVPPVEKVLACGDEGVGGLASVEAIVEQVRSCLDSATQRS